jgi:homoserine O-acetyltransferase
MSDFLTFELNNFELQCGTTLPVAKLAYKTYGELNHDKSNVVVLPTFYTGSHIRNEGFFAEGRAIDPKRHFIVSINLFGNAYSSSPSNTVSPFDGPRFPEVTLFDNVKAQHQLLTELFEISEIALVAGWSMAGCQSFQWAAQYPDMVQAILPFCGSAKTSIHNYVFLEGVKSALQADSTFKQGDYDSPPRAGLMAFGRVYAGWAFSQSFYRQHLYREKGFKTAEDLLQDWEQDHLDWDANNLLCKLKSWQLGDISSNVLYDSDFELALSSIKAKTIVISCDNDLYFRPEDNELEIAHIPNGEHRVFESAWGHCVASPGNSAEFAQYLDQAIQELLN